MASIGLGLAALLGGGISAAGSIAGSAVGANAASTAASEQAAQEQKALGFQQQIFGQQQQNIAPFLGAGTQSLSQLMQAIQGGKFGPGSLPPVPTAPGSFTAPTLAEAQATPGYQFTEEQGNKGILEGAGAAGGAISGGTLKSLAGYNTNLADTTYNDVFNRALSTYQGNLQGYQSQLAGYQTGESAQAQEFGQLFAPAQLGENAASSLNNTSTQQSTNLANLMTQLGATQAAGTVGTANAVTNGIGNATNSLSQSLTASQLLPFLLNRLPPSSAPAGTGPG